jgi:striatin 1/3/4
MAATDSDAADRLTAIFRPKSGTVTWRDHLREMAEKGSSGPKANATTSLSTDSASLDALSEKSLEVDSASDISETDKESNGSVEEEASTAEDERLWKSRKILRSHLDSVRAVAFGRSSDLALVTAGDDATVKVWRLNPHNLSAAG